MVSLGATQAKPGPADPAAKIRANDDGRPGMVGKVALAAVVGNEDGAHKVVADLFQALNDIGFTIPAPLRVARTGTARPCRAAISRTSTKCPT